MPGAPIGVSHGAGVRAQSRRGVPTDWPGESRGGLAVGRAPCGSSHPATSVPMAAQIGCFNRHHHKMSGPRADDSTAVRAGVVLDGLEGLKETNLYVVEAMQAPHRSTEQRPDDQGEHYRQPGTHVEQIRRATSLGSCGVDSHAFPSAPVRMRCCVLPQPPCAYATLT